MFVVMKLLPEGKQLYEWPMCREPDCPHHARYGIAEYSNDRTQRLQVLALCTYHFHNWGAKPPPYPAEPRIGNLNE